MKIQTDIGPIVKIAPPKKKEIRIIRFLIICACACLISFVIWFIDPEHIGYGPIFWLLTAALMFKLVKMIHEWYHYWSPSVPVIPENNKRYTVDILTTACPGEPKEMIVRTLRAMTEITYPHTNYLCDEGDDAELKAVCKELGVVHVTRIEKINAKAGNINNALKQASGEICVVLDPDHVPVPEFLDRVLPYFIDEKIGFVQCVQAYSNQKESIIALGAAEQTYHFYGPMMMCMNSYGTVQAIGANCTFRRSALDSIGGHAAGLSEDMHTAMQLHAKGWKSVYVPEALTRGLVPATLSAYYKQQLKWSRGTFELLFRTFPLLYKNFTWRQKIHYFTIPLYFLFGLINLIDIIIPVAALSLAEVPWAVNLGNFAMYFLPLCGLSLMIRLYAQRWLLEKQEHGFHLAGGLLRTATWWIFLIGFIYTIFNIKVPYIPTPKEEKHENYWVLCIPNIVVALLSFVAIFYGLSIDWTPYSIAMAFYGLVNAGILFFIVLMSQQRMMLSVTSAISKIPAYSFVVRGFNQIADSGRGVVYSTLRSGPVALLVGISMLFVSYSTINESKDRSLYKQKDFGGFYLGVNSPEKDNIAFLEKSIHQQFSVVAVDLNWNEFRSLPLSSMHEINNRNAIPLINWKPANFSDTGSANMFQSIRRGEFNTYLEKCAADLRKYREPVFINFAPGFDDPNSAWFVKGSDNGADFILAWQHVYTFFNNLGISNITWVWSPKSASSVNYYPGPKFVDWIGVSCLNYGENFRDNDWYSFTELYHPYRDALGKFQKPVMITEFGSFKGSDQAAWLNTAMNDIKENFHEVRSVILFNGTKTFQIMKGTETNTYQADFMFNSPVVHDALAKKLDSEPFDNRVLIKSSYQNQLPVTDYHSAFVNGTPGHFSLTVNNKNYYIRGVAYNTAHDWRDGNMPLTRKQVESDFEKIRAMGANTIRRYDHGIYDRNVLNIAGEYNLNVQYGFWFDPKVDYYKDTVRLQEYIDDVIEKVTEYKDHSSIVAWSLGNETWGLLKHNYSKPYLTKVRGAYVNLIEQLAQRIHAIDPSRPVFSSMEHEEYQLPGELVAFRDAAPSVDVIGVNSYYKEQISTLNHVIWEFDSIRPYLISEFGPRGYWDPTYNKTANGSLIEDGETEKANWYREQWTNYVAAYKGYNIGGFAYCWHDRMEGSFTWFGLTDFKGRPKPSYFALKQLWTNTSTEVLPEFTITSPATLIPGKEYSFTASSRLPQNKGLQYEWYLLKDEFLEKVDNVTVREDGRKVLVQIPEEKSDYRLYLYVSDASGNVTTASAPVKVQ